MQKPPFTAMMFLGFLGLSLVYQGLFALGQSTFDARPENGWRRTTQGWEQADSLPISKKSSHGKLEKGEVRFPTLSITMKTIHGAHRIALPVAIASFMACIGSWLLLRWPTSSPFLAPVKSTES